MNLHIDGTCLECGLDATHQAYMSDSKRPGNNMNEAGYKTVLLCPLHAEMYRRDVGNTARVQLIEEDASPSYP